MTQCVFLDSSNQLMSNVSFIKPKFPPTVDIWKLITKHVADSCKNSRSPNAFMIYRKVFVETARSDGYQLPMRVVSSLASKSWLTEPDMVKREYKRLSREANDLRDKMLPKAVRKRKKQKWNIVSFPSPSDVCNPVVKKKKSSNKKQLNIKPNDKVESSSSPPSPNKSEDPITFETPCDVPSPVVDLVCDSAFDHIPVPSFPDSQLQQQQHENLQEYNLDLENHPGFYEPIENNTAINFPIDSIPNDEFEYESPGFSMFYDDLDNCYPSFWFEY